MRPVKHKYTAVVLAGERPGGSAISQELGLATSVLVKVAGKSALARVIETLETSEMVEGGLLCGPVEEIYRDNEEFRQIIRASSFQWTAPESGPSASALAALEQLDRYPVLLTTGDHALLSPGVVDFFCREGMKMDVDVVCGLVPYAIVRAAYPESKRTVLKFRKLVAGEGYKPPVVRPGIIENTAHRLEISSSIPAIKGSHPDSFLQAFQQTLHDLGQGERVPIHFVAKRILSAAVTLPFDLLTIVGPCMTHHDVGWGIKAFHQAADFLVDAQVKWSHCACHFLLFQPGLGSSKQGSKHFDIIGCLNKSEETRVGVVVFQVQ